MRVLALDTATEGCSVALLTDGGLRGRWAEAGRGHAEQILGMVDAVLAEAGVSLAMLDGIAASVGPGAFTGVRISVAVAQGLAFGADLPVVPVTTLEALALQAMQGGAAGACVPGCAHGRGVLGLFRPRRAAQRRRPRRAPGGTGRAGEVPRGRALFRYRPRLCRLPGTRGAGGGRPHVQAEAFPDAREMARLGAVRLAAGAGMDPAELPPQYLRDKVALTEHEGPRWRPRPRRFCANGASHGTVTYREAVIVGWEVG